ncbi:hypothetical protein [Billgrantia gudaonensis]|uniref:Uncharacterized protein n=1 Tax=Billgrantia gudaonensis TaxID=376427 RepID=A0A1G9DQ73_9GAMM|nr:hypothetical protein [Halomonas gudaonensis]SDK65999.1 hypothetical protein SAMN04487954_12253 [Halomonas gudaonensis]
MAGFERSNTLCKTAPGYDPGLTSADKLAFLRDYIVRTRFDVMVDKQTLTQLFYLKLAVFAAAATALTSPVGTLAILALPIVLFTIDYLHRKRFCEIFRRWNYLRDHVVPRLRELEGFWNSETFRMLEQEIADAQTEISSEEAHIRWVTPVATGVLGLPLFPVLMIQTLQMDSRYAIVYMWLWAVVLTTFSLYFFCMNGQFKSTYPWQSRVLPVAFLVAALFFSTLQFSGVYDLVGTYTLIFASGS